LTNLPIAAKTHNLWLWYVKRNDGKVIRLALFIDLIQGVHAKRAEVEIRNLSQDEISNPMWQTDRMIWWHPLRDMWYEATQEDEQAKREYESVKANIGNFPDDEVDQFFVIEFDSEGKFKVVDGTNRRLAS
jgi:hypothetical protein